MALSRANSEQSIKLSSTTTSNNSTDTDRHSSVESRVCLVGDAGKDSELQQSLKDLSISFVTSKDGHEYLDDDDSLYQTIFIVDDFESEVFSELKQTRVRILGPPVIFAVAQLNTPIPFNSRPLYCTCMQGLNLCFTNFKTKDHLAHLVTLCHYMGACIRKEMTGKIDFLVTNSLHGPKYRTAVSLGTLVMKEEWVHKCWAARRRRSLFKATDDEFLAPCKSKPFEGCKMSFLGFLENEKKHMEEQAQEQGGALCDVKDPSCTHIVVEEQTVKSLSFVPEGRVYVVVQEWFWGSIQIEAKAAESMYIFDQFDRPRPLTKVSSTSSLLGTPRWRGSNPVSTRASTGRSSLTRKRGRLREETLAKLAQESEPDASRPPCKRPSTDTSACIPDSMLDVSSTSTNVKSPSDIFSLRRRSGGRRERRKLRKSSASRNSSRSSVSFSCTPELFSVSTQVETNVTPPGLLNHLKQLAKESPKTRSSPDGDCNKFSTRIRSHNQCQVQISLNQGAERSSSRSSLKHDRKEISPAFSDNLTTKPDRFLYPDQGEEFDQVFCNPRRHSTAFVSVRNQHRVASRRYSLLVINDDKLPLQTLSEDFEDSDDTIVQSFESSCLQGGERSSFNDVSDQETGNILVFEECNGKEKKSSTKPNLSARYQVAMEFLQTEKNYVGILQTILNLFKKPLDDPHQPGGSILASEDIKAIFGSLPEMECVHRSMRDRLEDTMQKWSDSTCVGNLVLSYIDEFGRCYPQFVNFFEASVETINRCDAKSPRFHAFLKINQAKKECGRQTLADLLINPVQRIPRIILLLQDIKKHTERENRDHPDVKGIDSCLDALKGVMAHINEDKRRTESQRLIFDIVYEVEGCPPTLVSSHRQFVSRAEVVAADDNLCSRGDHLSIFVFSDCVEDLLLCYKYDKLRDGQIAKRRRGVKNSTKSPTVHTRPPSSVKPMKHVKLMSLLHIKKVVDIKNSDDCEDAFSLYCRTPTDSQDWLYTFKILQCSEDSTRPRQEDSDLNNKENQPGGGVAKRLLLSVLARHRTNALCKTNDDNFVCSVEAHELDVSTNDLGSALGRAVRAAKKSSRKLTRAFSFNRTPRRNAPRTVSNLLSPAPQPRQTQASTSDDFVNSSDQSSSLTPSISMASLCTPKHNRKPSRMPSTTSLQLVEVMDDVHFQSRPLKSAVSTMTLARPQTRADMSDFPAIPTPPARRKKVASSIKAATISFGRSGSFRRKKKLETDV